MISRTCLKPDRGVCEGGEQGTYSGVSVARFISRGNKWANGRSCMRRLIQMLPTEYSDYLYVFWVKTGHETKSAGEIQAAFDDEVTPLQLMIETFFRKQGKVTKETRFAFPGYVFVVTEIINDEFVKRARECVWKSKSIIRLLCYGDTNDAAMRNEERAAIDCLWQGKDCVETSVGFIKGDHIVITDGHFKGQESIIKEVHPRRRLAIVEIEFMGGIRRATIGLEILEKLP